MVADAYDDYSILKQAFLQTQGYGARADLPADLVQRLARFCDTHANDMMMTYYASSLLDQFWRKRTAARRERFVSLMNAHMACKSALLALLGNLQHRDRLFGDACFALMPVWAGVRDLPAGHHKANQFHHHARFFRADELDEAYRCVLAMPNPYRTRAVAALYPYVGPHRQADILTALFAEVEQQNWEADAQLRRLFSKIDPALRTGVVHRYLETPGLSEHDLAYFVIHNAQWLVPHDARAIAVRLRSFKSDYLRIRSVLKLADHLPAQEITVLCEQFLASFGKWAASSALIHSLFHVSAFTSLSRADIVFMALAKIAQIDDSQEEVWNQEKYNLLSFLAPHLQEEHRDAAFAIAHTVRGGYRYRLCARLRRHFTAPGTPFVMRAVSIIY